MLRKAALPAPLVSLVLFGCSSVSLPREAAPADGPEPAYNALIVTHLKEDLKQYASYRDFEISNFRWVHSVKGWTWLTCIRFQEDKGRPRTYALFIKDRAIVDARFSVEVDRCGTQTYVPFAPMNEASGPTAAGALGPLY